MSIPVTDQINAVAAAATWAALAAALTEHAVAVDAVVAIIRAESIFSASYPWARERLDAVRQQVETCWWLHFGEAPPAT